MVTTRKPETQSESSPQPESEQWDSPPEMTEPLRLKLPAEWRLSDEALIQFFELNGLLSFERSEQGELIISPPPLGPSPTIGSEIIGQLYVWMQRVGVGQLRDSSGGFNLGEPRPAGLEHLRASYQPDVSWISQEMADELGNNLYERVIPDFNPPFVVEIITAAQRVPPQHRKMRDYIRLGVRLGWLIDPQQDKVWIYRAGQDEPDELDRPATLSGEDVLDGFELDCARIWRPRD